MGLEAFLVILVIPTLGGSLLLAEWQSRSALSRRERSRSRIAVLVLGIVLLPVAAALIAFAAWRFWQADALQSVYCVIQVLLLCVLLMAAWSAIRLSRFGEEQDLPVREAARRYRYADQMRLSSWLLVCFPLLWLVAAAVVIVAPLLYLVAIWSTAVRARQGRLLWLLTIAVENGMPLADELDAFALEFYGPRQKRLWDLANRLRDGSSLSDGLEVDGGLLPAADVLTIRVGEETGTLPAALRNAALRHTDVMRHMHLDGSLAALASYYWLVIAALFFMMSGLMYWIVPKFKVIFDDFGVPLPEVTKIAIELSDQVATYFWLIIPAASLPMSLLFLLSYMYLVGWGNLNWPLVMRWFPRRDAPGILRGLAVAAASERPLPPVVGTMAERHPRRDLGERLERIGRCLDAGHDPWASLREEGFLSVREAEAVSAASRARHLPLALHSLADSIDRIRRQRLLWLIELVNPLVVLALGAFVTLYCLAFFLPLVQIINSFE
jgi:type II secretory pathway component PulF